MSGIKTKSVELSVCFSLFLIVLKYIYTIDIPESVFLFFSVCVGIVGNTEDILRYCLVCIPLSSSFQYKFGLLICLVFHLVKTRSFSINRKTLFVVLFILFFELLHLNSEDSFIDYFRSMAELVTIAMLIIQLKPVVDYQRTVRLYSSTILSICIIMIILRIANSGLGLIGAFSNSYMSYRFGDSSTDMVNYTLSFNPNVLGLIINLAISGELFVLRKEKSIIDVILMTGCVFFGIATMSRSFLLCFFFQVCSFVLLGHDKVQARVKRVLLLSFALIILLYAIYELIPDLLDNILLRFQEADISNGRFYLFKEYLHYMFGSVSSFIWGSGLQNYSQKVAYYLGYQINACHNGFQEAFVIWGVCGGLISLFFLATIVLDAKRIQPDKDSIQYIPFLIIILNCNFGQLFSSGIVILTFCYALFFLCILDKECVK